MNLEISEELRLAKAESRLNMNEMEDSEANRDKAAASTGV